MGQSCSVLNLGLIVDLSLMFTLIRYSLPLRCKWGKEPVVVTTLFSELWIKITVI